MGTVKIEGMDELLAKLNKLKGVKTNKACLAGIQVIQVHSQENAPYVTGYLRSSAESHENANGAELDYTASYSLWNEIGTSKMKGKHFVGRAINENTEEILNAVARQMDDELGGV